MPVYEYECNEHGLFETLRPLSEYDQPSPCPTCDNASLRVLSVPHLVGVPRATMIAHDRNEQSRHEPRVSQHKHGDHAHHDAHTSVASAAKKALAQGQRPALQNYSGKRPWVMEHG
ncbi:MAG: FmdB family regulatory protein [Pseudomonadota bacterium]